MRASYNHLVGATDGPLEHLPVAPSINTGRLYGLSQVFVATAGFTAPAPPEISDHFHPGDRGRLPSRRGRRNRGDVFRGGDRSRHAAGRAVGQERDRDRRHRVQRYVRGSGTTKLVFAFTVPSGLKDDDGIELAFDPLRLNGATIVTEFGRHSPDLEHS